MSDTDILEDIKRVAEIQAMPTDEREKYVLRVLLRLQSNAVSEKTARDVFRQEITASAAALSEVSEAIRSTDLTNMELLEKRLVNTICAYEIRINKRLDDEIEAREGLCKTVLHLRLALAGLLGGLGALKWIIELMHK